MSEITPKRIVRRGSIVVTDDGRDIELTKSHTPSDRFVIENADREDATRAMADILAPKTTWVPPTVPPARAIEVARAAAASSPCAKSKRGAVLFWSEVDQLSGMVKEITAAHNGPPASWRCDGSAECRDQCGRTCMHAESRSISIALKVGIHMMPVHAFTDQMLCHANNYDMLHVKVVDGQVVPGGPPSCIECSKQILEFGLRGMWLYELPSHNLTGHDLRDVVGTWRRYTAREFHYETLCNNRLLVHSSRSG